ncbi:MAG: GxxExxY protein [Bacteroidales bacterium]|nr:GxxExxY protein [Bacteroidales bacterium]
MFIVCIDVMKELIYQNESAAINKAVFEVHKRLGVGLQEVLYQEALALEFEYQGIPFEREKRFNVYYRGQRLHNSYYADFLCYNKIIVELKSVSVLIDQHKAQLRNYLGIAGMRLGLLYNFNDLYMRPVRVLNANMSDCQMEDFRDD